jgi:hypothetical protein
MEINEVAPNSNYRVGVGVGVGVGAGLNYGGAFQDNDAYGERQYHPFCFFPVIRFPLHPYLPPAFQRGIFIFALLLPLFYVCCLHFLLFLVAILRTSLLPPAQF